jgi:hypothetical protein
MSEDEKPAKIYLGEVQVKKIIVEVEGREIEFDLIGQQKVIIEFEAGKEPVFVDNVKEEIAGYVHDPGKDKTTIMIECTRLFPAEVHLIKSCSFRLINS